MADNVQTTTEAPPSMASLVQGIVSDAQTLIRQEITLARTEIKKDWKDLREAGAALSVGGVVALLGGLMLCFMVVYLLFTFLFDADLHYLWICYLIVGAVLGVTGAVFLARGIKKLGEIEPGPEQTIQSIKEII